MTETELWILVVVLLLVGLVWVVAVRGPKPAEEAIKSPVDPTWQATLDAIAFIRRTRPPWRPECFWVNPDQRALDWLNERAGPKRVPSYLDTDGLAALTGIPIRPNPMIPSMMLMYEDLHGKMVFLDFRGKDEEQK